MSIPQNLPMSPKEIATAAEVFEQYEGLDMQAAWEALRKRALDTDRPFRAYDCAHAVAGCLQPADKADEAFQAWQRIFEKSRESWLYDWLSGSRGSYMVLRAKDERVPWAKPTHFEMLASY